MFALLAIVFLLVPLVEIYVLILVGGQIGALNTIGVLILISLVGAWLAKREGLGVLTRLRDQLDAGRMPTNELIDGGLVLVGGLMLVFPGFVTDALGLLLLFPPTRAGARWVVRRRLRVRVYGVDVSRIGRAVRPDDGPDVIDV